MRTPRMTLRRWYWVGVLAALLWLVLGLRVFGRSDRNPGLAQQAEQSVGGQSAKMLLTPVSLPVAWVQEKIEGIASGGGGVGEPKRMRELEEQVRTLQNEKWRLQGDIEQLIGQMRQYKMAVDLPGVAPEDVVVATVTGRGSGVDTEVLTIDVGSHQKVKVGQVVMAEQVPVGRVMAVGPVNATVRLMTDPGAREMRLNAQLVRPVPGTDNRAVEIAKDCQVRGKGGGMLVCTIGSAIGKPAPQPGDFLRVADNDWRPLYGAVIGDVVEVSKLDPGKLRYELVVRPRVQMNTLGRVTVLVK